MKTVTKAQAAVMLGISPKEVVRRIESGALKGRKKTASKFSDWIVEIPDEGQETKTVANIKEALVEPEMPKEEIVSEEKEEMKEEAEEIQHEIEESAKRSQEEQPKTEHIEVKVGSTVLGKIGKKEVKTDDRAKSEDREVKWWFGNSG